MYNRINVPLKAYKKEKLRMLKDFLITLTEEQTERLMQMTREIDIDNFCKSLIMHSLGV